MLNNIPSQVSEAEVLFINHSAGKDSQAMLAAVHKAGFKGKIVIVHADLGEMEWEPMHHFIESNSFGYEVHVVKPPMDFFQLCKRYNRLPSGLARFCTSDMKTQPIGRFIKKYCRDNGIKSAINCIGIRAEESPARAKKEPFKLSKMSLKRDNIQIWEWYPIFDYKLNDVWNEISSVGQEPHKLYSEGFSRLSCVFCVFGRKEEHQKAAKLRPELFNRMVELEKDLGKSIRLKTVNGQKVNQYLTEYI
jgi:3'-phosphoadenosine 5'-phosphosulfate sulfotransferase (PAPS reductase)/FAD synthetase